MKTFITSDGVMSVVYKSHLDTEYGDAWLDWEPETLWTAMEEKWGHAPSEGAKAAIMATRVLLSSGSFYDDIPTFEAVVLGLNNHQPVFTRLEVAAPHEIAHAIAQEKILRDRPETGFSEEVIHYIQGSMIQYGNFAYPSLMQFAEPSDDKAKRNEIRKAAKTPVKNPESLVEVQAAKLHDLYVYMEARKDEIKAMKK